jgi:chemotaxis protein MotD
MADSIEAPALETTLARAATANAATANPSDNSAGLRPKPNVPAPQPEPSAQSLQAPAKVQGQPQSVEIAKSAEAPAPSIDQPAARNPANPSAPPTILPEPVRALAASLNPASLHARTGVESNPVPLTGLALAVEIVSRLREGLRRFDIRLDPPELGRIDVRLDVDRHGHATTRMTVDRPETLDLLQREARGLERALQQAGLKTEDGALEFSLRYQAQDGASDRQPHRFAEERTGMLAVDDSELVMAAGLQRYALAAHARGGIDIRV